MQLAADLPHLVAGLALVDGGWRPYADRSADLDTAWRRMAPPDLTGFAIQDVDEALAGAHPAWSPAAVEATLANAEQRPGGTLCARLTRRRHYDRIASLFAHRPHELHRGVRCHTVLLAADDPPHPSARAAASKPRPGTGDAGRARRVNIVAVGPSAKCLSRSARTIVAR